MDTVNHFDVLNVNRLDVLYVALVGVFFGFGAFVVDLMSPKAELYVVEGGRQPVPLRSDNLIHHTHAQEDLLRRIGPGPRRVDALLWLCAIFLQAHYFILLFPLSIGIRIFTLMPMFVNSESALTYVVIVVLGIVCVFIMVEGTAATVILLRTGRLGTGRVNAVHRDCGKVFDCFHLQLTITDALDGRTFPAETTRDDDPTRLLDDADEWLLYNLRDENHVEDFRFVDDLAVPLTFHTDDRVEATLDPLILCSVLGRALAGAYSLGALLGPILCFAAIMSYQIPLLGYRIVNPPKPPVPPPPKPPV